MGNLAAPNGVFNIMHPAETIIKLGEIFAEPNWKVTMSATLHGDKLVDHLPYTDTLVINYWTIKYNEYHTMRFRLTKNDLLETSLDGHIEDDKTI